MVITSFKRHFARAIGAALISFAFAGCGGGGGGSRSIPATNTPTTKSKFNATATIVIPPRGGSSSAARHPQWISPLTQAVDFTSVVNGFTVAYTFVPLTPTSPNCGPGPAGLTCTVAFSVVPGPQTITVNLYDNSNFLLASPLADTTQTFNLAGGVTNPNLNFVLNGMVAMFAPTTGPPNFTSGTAGSQIVTVTAQDADGENIPGSWDVPSISTAILDDSTHALSVTPSLLVPAPSTNLTFNYSGNPNTATTLGLNYCSPFWNSQLNSATCPGAPLIIVDVPSQSLYVSNSTGGSVIAFAPNANGNVAPIRVIPTNTLSLNHIPIGGGGNPGGIAQNGGTTLWTEPSTNSTVQAQAGVGNTSPFSMVIGMCGGFSGGALLHPAGIAVASGAVWVTNNNGTAILKVHQCGGSAPYTTISGAATTLNNASGIAFDGANNIYVINNGNQLLKFAATATGNVAPIASLSTPPGALFGAAGIAVSGATIYVADSVSNQISEYPTSLPNSIPTVTLSGTNTQLATPTGVAVDAIGNIYVANSASNAITVYAPGAIGNVAPIRTISGASTTLNGPLGVAIRP